MARGGSKPGERRGGREPGTPNKLPKGERALVKLDAAERELRVLAAAGKDITTLGKDRLAELDQWAYGMAQRFAPKEKDGKTYWDNDGDELRFMRFMSLESASARSTEKSWLHFWPPPVDFCSSRLALGAATERARAMAMPAGTRAQALQTRL